MKCYAVDVSFPTWCGIRAHTDTYYVAANSLIEAASFLAGKYPYASCVGAKELGTLNIAQEASNGK
jgi:hypothetical protein